MAADCNVSAFELGGLSPQDIINCGLSEGSYASGSMSPAEIIAFITTWISYLAYFLCLIGFIVGFISIISSAGDKTKLSNGKNILKFSSIAFIFVLMATQILVIILDIFGY
jgi:NhaP-type Na+/H+ or K+/H+ antiporter